MTFEKGPTLIHTSEKFCFRKDLVNCFHSLYYSGCWLSIFRVSLRQKVHENIVPKIHDSSSKEMLVILHILNFPYPILLLFGGSIYGINRLIYPRSRLFLLVASRASTEQIFSIKILEKGVMYIIKASKLRDWDELTKFFLNIWKED